MSRRWLKDAVGLLRILLTLAVTLSWIYVVNGLTQPEQTRVLEKKSRRASDNE